MARLNVAVEAVYEKVDSHTWLSIYVTDENREPVAGLKQTHFTVRFLAPVFEQTDVAIFMDEALSALPGLYYMKLTGAGTPYGYILGVTVRKPRKPAPRHRDGGGIVAAEFDSGFGMATAVRCE